MAASLSLSESQCLTALRGFLTGVLASGVEVVRGQDNRVPEPLSGDYVVMTPILRERLETNTTTYSDTPQTETRLDLMPTRYTVQLDVHGPSASDNSQVIATLFRSEYATTAFAAAGFDVTPLYTSDPRQMAFINGEQQYEDRWSIDAVMQVNPIVTTTQQFADVLDVGIIEVDATYPP